MKKDVTVPSLGESIVEATVGQILVSDGALVTTDQELIELETDKVNQVLYSPANGKMHISVKTGDVVKIGQVIGSIEEMEVVSKKEEERPSEIPSLIQPPKDTLSSLRQSKEDFLENLDQVKKEEEPLKKEETEGERESRRPMSKIRKVISQRLVEAQHTMAMLTTFNEVDMTPIIELR